MPIKLRSTELVDREDRIFATSLASLQLWLTDAWNRVVEDPKLTVTFSDTPEADAQVAIASGTPRYTPDRLPWVSLVMATFQDRTSGPFAPWQMQTFGIDLAKAPRGARLRVPRDIAKRAYIRPVSVGVGIKMRCQSIEEARVFASIWVRYQPSFCYDLREKSSGARFRIHVTPEGAITLPQLADGSGPQGQTYDLETTLIVDTYVGHITTANVIKTVDINIMQPPIAIGKAVSEQIRLGGLVYHGDCNPPVVEFKA